MLEATRFTTESKTTVFNLVIYQTTEVSCIDLNIVNLVVSTTVKI